MKKLTILTVIVFIASLTTGVLLPSSAHAASQYDSFLDPLNGPMKLDNWQMDNIVDIESTYQLGTILPTIQTPSYCTAIKETVVAALAGDTPYIISYTPSTASGAQRWYGSITITVSSGGFGNTIWSSDWAIVPGGTAQIMINNIGGTPQISSCADYGDTYIGSTHLYPTYVGYNTGAYLMEYRGYTITYPVDYEGTKPEAVTSDKTLPKFGWSVFDDLRLQALYLRNLDIPLESSPALYNWTYRLYQTNNQYDTTSIEPTESKTLDFRQVFETALPSRNYYVLKISLSVTPPGAPRSDIQTVTFQIDATSGQFKSGSTDLNECDENGVCKDSSEVCNWGDLANRLNCQMIKLTSSGVINPSINQFIILIGSFTVSSQPSCYIPLSNVAIGQQTLQLSSYSTIACQKAEVFRSTFPVIPLMVNFVFALGVFVMIVRIINRLTDKKHNDMIEVA